MTHFKKVVYNQTNMQYRGKRQSKLAQNETIQILYEFHDFPILAYLRHVDCRLQHVHWHLHNPWG